MNYNDYHNCSTFLGSLIVVNFLIIDLSFEASDKLLHKAKKPRYKQVNVIRSLRSK